MSPARTSTFDDVSVAEPPPTTIFRRSIAPTPSPGTRSHRMGNFVGPRMYRFVGGDALKEECVDGLLETFPEPGDFFRCSPASSAHPPRSNSSVRSTSHVQEYSSRFTPCLALLMSKRGQLRVNKGMTGRCLREIALLDKHLADEYASLLEEEAELIRLLTVIQKQQVVEQKEQKELSRFIASIADKQWVQNARAWYTEQSKKPVVSTGLGLRERRMNGRKPSSRPCFRNLLHGNNSLYNRHPIPHSTSPEKVGRGLSPSVSLGSCIQ